MRRGLLKNFFLFVVPMVMLAMGPAQIVLCKMGMQGRSPCCKKMLQWAKPVIPQIAKEGNCCTVFQKSLLTASTPTHKANELIFGKALSLGANHTFPHDAFSFAGLNLQPWLQTLNHSPPPLFLLKQSFLI